MKKLIFYCILFVITISCIPTKIAPKIETNKVMVAKKFKRNLPKQNAFIFEDPKEANHFYTYLNKKFRLNNLDVAYNVPIKISDKTYYLSFYEAERETKTVNLIPFAVDAKLKQGGNTPILEDAYVSRKGNYYLALTVSDNDFKDCLSENYENKNKIITFLEKMRIEYLNTYNYEELLFEKKS